MQKKDQNYIKKENEGIVLDLIRTYGMISRAKLAKMTKMSATTVSRIASSLMELNLIQETNQYTTGVGRKAALLTMNPDSMLSVGVELDDTKIRVGFVNFLGNVIFSEKRQKNSRDSPELIISFLKEMIFRLIDKHQINSDKIIGVCIGLPGLINNETGNVNISTQLDWHDIQLAEKAKNELGFPVNIDNELKLKAYAESLFGKAQKSKRFIMLGFGSGVGSALMIDNKIYRGHLNTAGEIGHTIVDPNGMLCTCGNFGCLQTYIAERFLLKEASKNSEVHCLEDIIHAAKIHEKWAENIINRAVTYASITINNSVCLNNPDTIVLTGSLIDKSTYIRDEILKACEKQLWTPLKNTFALHISEIGSLGVVLGAGMAIQRDFVVHHLNFERGL